QLLFYNVSTICWAGCRNGYHVVANAAFHGEVFDCPHRLLCSQCSGLFPDTVCGIVRGHCAIEGNASDRMLRVQIKFSVRNADIAGKGPVWGAIRLWPSRSTYCYAGLLGDPCACRLSELLQNRLCEYRLML